MILHPQSAPPGGLVNVHYSECLDSVLKHFHIAIINLIVFSVELKYSVCVRLGSLVNENFENFIKLLPLLGPPMMLLFWHPEYPWQFLFKLYIINEIDIKYDSIYQKSDYF